MEWLEIRKEEARKIDPETAEVKLSYACPVDPYGICDLFRLYYKYSGEDWSVRDAGSDWIWAGDVPDETWRKIQERPFAAYCPQRIPTPILPFDLLAYGFPALLVGPDHILHLAPV